MAFNLSRLQPVITGAVAGLGICCFVTLPAAVLGVPHLWNHLQYHFCSQQCGLWCAAKCLMFKGLVWLSFNTSVFAIFFFFATLQVALVSFSWAAGEDELGCSVYS